MQSKAHSAVARRNLYLHHMQPLGPERWTIARFLHTCFRSRKAVAICFALAWLNKCLIAYFFTSLYGDKSLYLLFSQSMLQGHLPLEPVQFLGSGATQYLRDPGIASPLYSLLAMPFLALTHSYFLTSFCLDVLAWALLLGGLYALSIWMLKERWMTCTLLLCLGFFLYPHELGSSPKDSFAAGFSLWGIYCAHRFMTEEPSRGKALAVLFCCIALALTKLQCLPISFALLLVVLVHAFQKKESVRRRQAVIMMAVFLVLVSLSFYFFYYLKQFSVTTIVHYAPGNSGFYPSNLFAFFPFISSSFINTNFWGVQLSQLLHRSFTVLQRAFQLFDLLLLGLLVYSARFIKKLRKEDRWLFMLLAMVSAAEVIPLAYISLRNEAVAGGRSEPWTFVQEARSFLIAMIAIQILLFYLVFRSRRIHIFLRTAVLLLFFFEALHGLYFTVKNAVVHPPSGPLPARTVFILYDSLQKSKASPLVLVSSDELFRRFALIKGREIRSLPYFEGRSLPRTDTQYLMVSFPADSFHVRQQFLHYRLQPPDTIGLWLVQRAE